MAEIGISCESCPYFVINDDAKSGVCRRHPPTVFIVPGPPDALGRPSARTQAVWPAMGTTDWCGEHIMFGTLAAMPIDSRLADAAQGKA